MSFLCCEICGGNIIINRNSFMGTCDSCGKNTEFDEEKIKKYRTIFERAERRMQLNSMSGFKEAIELFNDVRFIDGADERIKECNVKISLLENKNLMQKNATELSDENNEKIGLVLIILFVVAFLLLVAGVCLVGYKLFKNEISPEVITVGTIFIVVSVVIFIVSKINC